jgi:hypothetical protein
MKLREEFELLGSEFPWKEKELLDDSEDSFSYFTHDTKGNPLIVGWNRSTEIFWRNQTCNGNVAVDVSDGKGSGIGDI